MIAFTLAALSILSATSVSITEPEDQAAYNLEELPGFRAIVENENAIPDSVLYSLNGGAAVSVPRLSTDWPTYMQNYVNHGYSESPAPTDDTILWTAPVTGTDHEFPTPVVVEGIVYYPQDHGGDSLYALDAATGELIWKYCVGTNDDAVTVQDGVLYAASDSLFCLDALSGERKWASGDADWLGSTPVVIDDRVYCGKGPAYGEAPPYVSYISCLATSDGSNIWTTPLKDCLLFSCMAVWNGYLFVPTWLEDGETSLYALDVQTGEILWENDDSHEGYWDSSPVVVDSVIYINGRDGYTRGIDAVSGNTIWATFAHPATATAAYHDGRLYFANEYYSFYHCVDVLSGLHSWVVPGRQHGSSAIAEGMVFYGQINSSGNSGIRALDCQTGAEVWSFYVEHSGWIAGSPSVTDGVVYIPMHDGNLYAFGTGLKYTYSEELPNTVVGWNQLVATSYDDWEIASSDTISYYVNQTGIGFHASPLFQPLFHLESFPNPFSSSTTLSFTLQDAGFTSVDVYDLSGRKVAGLVQEHLAPGEHTVRWSGTGDAGEGISSGLYICRILSGGRVETVGLCLIR